MTKKIVLVVAMVSCLARAGTVHAQAPAPDAQPPAAPAAAAGAAAAGPITDADLKAAVKPTDRANGDPDGALTGTANDIAISDPKAGLTVADVLNQIGANRIGVNFAWTLLCGFLIMFMQAGFAVVEAGLCRAKNANHTMMMNFMVYGVGMLAYFLIGFPLQMGGAGADRESRRDAGPQFRVHDSPVREGSRPLRQHRLSPDAPRHLRRGGDGDLPVPDGVHGHHDDDRHGHVLRALEVFRVHGVDDVPGRVHVSDFRQLGVGRRLARDAGSEFRPGPWLCRLRRLGRGSLRGRHHRAGVCIHPRPAHREIHPRRQGQRHPRARHHVGADRVLHPGVRMVRVQSRIDARDCPATAVCAPPRSPSTRCWQG